MRLNKGFRNKAKSKGDTLKLNESSINVTLEKREFVFVHDEQTKRALYYLRLMQAFRMDILICGPV